MPDFVPGLAVLTGYLIGVFVIVITPGPDMTFFLGRTLSQGMAAGVVAMMGAVTGLLTHSTAVAFGLSALIVASPVLFTVIKIAGALYLGWLAIDAIRNGSALNMTVVERRARSLHGIWLQGLAINLLNPKIVLFFLTYLPQFVDPSNANAPQQLLFLGLLFAVTAIPLTLPMIFAAGALTGFVRRRPSVSRGIDYLFATVFGAFAARILLTARS